MVSRGNVMVGDMLTHANYPGRRFVVTDVRDGEVFAVMYRVQYPSQRRLMRLDDWDLRNCRAVS